MKVTTQVELDAALANPRVKEIIIDSPRGVWLQLSAYGSASVTAYGSASVRASGSASVRAYGSASVTAYGSASVRAYGSASVEAYGSASVEAYGSASVRAYGSASVRAYDSASVRAGRYVAIHLFSKRVTLAGEGHVIDVTDVNTNRVPDFIDYHGVAVEDGWATVYKAVDDNLESGWHMRYPIGETVTAPDWNGRQECGGGLHFGYRPAIAKSYFSRATRFLECRVRVEGLIALHDKVKAESCVVVREVNIHGEPVAS